ncbi:MAG TPA: crosslink repair DNA glycosylase YcaQ family protein [Terriglobales bacterium]|nr:crosslink repair DNA glycosylase YcaQ family protein [Terriglobales bacterium]
MTDSELIQLRREKWRIAGNPVRTLEDGRGFIESVGFCPMLPLGAPLSLPTFVGAWSGSDEKLPTQKQAFTDQRAKDATELMVRLLRDKSAYEATLLDESNAFLLSASLFPYFYALVGERNPRQAPKAGPRSPYSQLACDVYVIIHRKGPISKLKLLEDVGKGISVPALDRALADLWSKLRITRVDYHERDGASWDVLQRWAPEAVSEGVNCSVNAAISALLSKYLDCVVAADQQELESFFGNFVARSRVREAVNALLAARELSFVPVGNRSLIQVTQAQPVRRLGTR